MMEDGADGNPYATGTPTGRLNYWGYGAGYLFAPKASYTSGKEKEPEREFKDLVKEFHKNDIEVLVELYFTGEESAALAQEAVGFTSIMWMACTCPGLRRPNCWRRIRC